MSNTENNPVFHYTLHQRLWNHLANNPGMLKTIAIINCFTYEEMKKFEGADCTACAYAKNIIHNQYLCDKCPLDASKYMLPFGEGCLNGLYSTWFTLNHLIRNAKGPSECDENLVSTYARTIANLPVKEGVPFD